MAEALLQIKIDASGAIAGAKQVEDSLKRISQSAEKTLASLQKIGNAKVAPTASTGPTAPSGTPAGPSGGAAAGAQSARDAQRLNQAMANAVRSMEVFGRAATQAGDAAARAAASLRAIQAPRGAAPPPAPPAAVAPLPVAAGGAATPAPVSNIDISRDVVRLGSALSSVAQLVEAFGRAASQAAEGANSAAAALRSVRPTQAAPTRPAPAASTGRTPPPSAAPSNFPTFKPLPQAPHPTPATDGGGAQKTAAIQRLSQALSTAARAAEVYGRAASQAADAALRAAAALRSVRVPQASASVRTPVGAPGPAPGIPGATAGPGIGGLGATGPAVQAFTATMAQATAVVAAASQGMTAAMQAAATAATAFARAAQRPATAPQGTGRGSGGAGGGGTGGTGGGLGGGLGGANPTGSGGAGNPAAAIARQTQAAATAATRSAATFGKAFEKIHDSISSTTERLTSLRTAFVALGAGVALKSLAETGMKFESLTKALNIVTGDSAIAKAEMARLREETDRLGLVTSSLSDDYVKFLAAIKGSSVDADMAKDAFFGVAQAMSLLGKSEEQTSRALKAIEQIASKGQVYAEELKGQLGDALPGAINTAATAMGYSVERMFQEMEKGNVSAEKFFATFNQELQIKFPVDRMDSARASVNRLTNAWEDFKKLMANSGFLDAWADAADKLAAKLNSIEGRVLAQELGEALGKAVTATANAMVWLADNADKVKIALMAIVGIQIVGFLAGMASAALRAAGAFKILWAAAGMSGIGRIARGIGAVGAALGLGGLAAGMFGDEAEEMSDEVKAAENAIGSYYDKIKSGKKVTDDMTEAQRDLAIEMANTAIAAEKSKLGEIQKERKQLVDIAAPPEASQELKDQIVRGEVKFDENSTDEVIMRLNELGKEAEVAGSKVAELQRKLDGLNADSADASKLKPKPPEGRKDLLPALPKGGGRGGENVGARFEEQRRELAEQIKSEGLMASSYDMGTTAVEEQARAMHILNQVQGLNPKYTKAQVATLEGLIAKLYDVKKASEFNKATSGMVESIAQTQQLTDATAKMADGAEGSAAAMRDEQAAMDARTMAIQIGVSGDKDRVNSLTELFKAQQAVNQDRANNEARLDFTQEIDGINQMIGALDLEGIARTRRIAEIEEENRLIKENADLTSQSAQQRIQAAGDVAAAEMGGTVKSDLKAGEGEIDTINRQMSAMSSLGEARIRQMAEIEKTAELEARGADMTDRNTEALIRQAGDIAVNTSRLEGMNDALDDLANSGLTLNQQMRQIAHGGLMSLEDALVDIITGTKSVKEAFADMAKAVAADLARMAVRQAITIPLAGLLGMGPMGVMHTGGIVGRDSVPTRMMPTFHTGGIIGSRDAGPAKMVAANVNALPKFHTGGSVGGGSPGKLAANEVPAVLQRGEGVFTQAQMAALGPAGGSQTVVVSPTINVQQPPGATEQQGQSFGKGISRELQAMVDDRINRAFRPGGIRNQSGAG